MDVIPEETAQQELPRDATAPAGRGSKFAARLPRIRHLFRFSIRSLFLLITVVAVWLAVHIHRGNAQRDAVKAIGEYGGWVRYDYQFPSGNYSYKDFDSQAASSVPTWLLDELGVDFFHNVVQVNLNYSEDSGSRQDNDNPSDEALAHLPSLPCLRVLLLSDTQASDEGMRHLARLKRLERLMMWDVTEVSDAGVAHLKDLRNLRYIHLSQSKITDRSLAVFANMPKLDGLSLQFNHLSDEGLKHVTGLTQLESLWVCGRRDRENDITDEGLRLIEGMKNLKELGIQHTHVTDEGVRSFTDAVPGCQISR